MLQLTPAPTWQPAHGPATPLPATPGAALLICLALRPGWQPHQRLAAVLHPDAADDAQALASLAGTLADARQLLQTWGRADALNDGEQGLRLDLPTEPAAMLAGPPGDDSCQLAERLHTLGLIGASLTAATRALQLADSAAGRSAALCVLGQALTSAGRHDEANDALRRALEQAREQADTAGQARARLRRARLDLQRGDPAAARNELAIAAALMHDDGDPLRLSLLLLTQVQADTAVGLPLPPQALPRLQQLAQEQSTPPVQVRLARVQVIAAFVQGDMPAALRAAQQQAALALHAGLQEQHAEALWLQARIHERAGAPPAEFEPLARAAVALCAELGLGELQGRVQQWAVEQQHAAAYRSGTQLWRQGRVAEAESTLRALLEQAPGYGPAMQVLGALLADAGQPDEAQQWLQRAVDVGPNDASAHHNLGALLISRGKLGPAREHLRRALQLRPDDVATLSTLAGLEMRAEQPVQALQMLERAVQLQPDSAVHWQVRGDVLCKLSEMGMNRRADAVQSFRKALELGGDAAALHFKLAAMGEEAAPAAMPQQVVASLFDDYAPLFDEHLLSALQYRTPQLVGQLLQHLPHDASAEVLDLGCGTGLCAPVLRPLARRLIGVDLSAGMLERARGRGYDEVLRADIIEHLLGQMPASVDLAIAADVLIYLGNLQPLFKAVRRVLKPGGAFVFSIETLDGDADYRLLPTRRYAHAAAYVRRLGADLGMPVNEELSGTLRRNAGADVAGHVMRMQAG